MKRPQRQAAGEMQNALWDWCLRKYFDYLDAKGRLGGFPTELKIGAVSAAKFAPEVPTSDLLQELIGQYLDTIWHTDPARRPASGDEGTAASSDKATEAATADRDRSDKRADAAEEEPTLFSVAGVSIAPSYTMADLNVPGGYRRVLGRWATLRIMDMDSRVKLKKAEESADAAQRAVEDAARVRAVVANPDALLWDHRDQQQHNRGNDGADAHP